LTFVDMTLLRFGHRRSDTPPYAGEPCPQAGWEQEQEVVGGRTKLWVKD
jgi:hypothetical protein